MSDTEKLLEKAYDALETSKILLESGKYNAAISQAYYSMYYAAKALLSVKNLNPKTHRGVVVTLGLEFVNKGYLEEIYGAALAKAFRRREQADYDLYYRASEEEAALAIDDAEKFLERIKSAVKQLKG
ncbi:HEPN domain-containing protein [Geoglobus ahangari]|uniref:HEPN domain-containing protein n=1 Tax=Geoglobus ahangari TaxID=113653 RepID=UPI00064FBBE2|nr:HEPN domain-containing protein [Geoglobus ahangari]